MTESRQTSDNPSVDARMLIKLNRGKLKLTPFMHVSLYSFKSAADRQALTHRTMTDISHIRGAIFHLQQFVRYFPHTGRARPTIAPA
jgi:hypothetical protein